MAFIETISPTDADADVLAMYERQRAHYGYVPSYAEVFCYRPEIMRLWAQLQSGIKRHMDKRRFELVTFAAAHALRSTLCTLAHGKALLAFFSADDVMTMARGGTPPALTPAEAALMRFARAVARDASSITADDVAELKAYRYSDAEVFDVVATAAGRAFFTTIVESLGVAPDAPLRAMDADLRAALTVGRPIELVEPERLDEPEFRAIG
jgi:alkylhydroperoxidase family enzyme